MQISRIKINGLSQSFLVKLSVNSLDKMKGAENVAFEGFYFLPDNLIMENVVNKDYSAMI